MKPAEASRPLRSTLTCSETPDRLVTVTASALRATSTTPSSPPLISSINSGRNSRTRVCSGMSVVTPLTLSPRSTRLSLHKSASPPPAASTTTLMVTRKVGRSSIFCKRSNESLTAAITGARNSSSSSSSCIKDSLASTMLERRRSNFSHVSINALWAFFVFLTMIGKVGCASWVFMQMRSPAMTLLISSFPPSPPTRPNKSSCETW
mmetsp:Transcript_12828/g.26172  ORF Transcript_12828/g.26172 Transcript_12828/m.26172 type:complete len:207 (-) Transcript_12828:4401-5021(-)